MKACASLDSPMYVNQKGFIKTTMYLHALQFSPRRFPSTVILLGVMLSLPGCGAYTGIPAHGGGKRFAIEQELVSASSHGALKQIDLSKLKGKKVQLFINAIGDIGAGNLTGGRMSMVSQVQGDYIQAPPTITRNTEFPGFTTTTDSSSTTNNSSGSTTSGTTSTSPASSTITSEKSNSVTNTTESSTTNGSSTSTSVLAYPGLTTSRQQGSGGSIQAGIQYQGLGDYHNSETLFGSSDLQYLAALLQTYLFLKGVHMVPPSEADIDIYVSVNVFGTVRTRVDWLLANNEILQARTALEIMAVDRKTGKIVMPPQDVGAEAEYNEQYLIWVGPFWARKFMNKTEPPLCDFADLSDGKSHRKVSKEEDEPIEYPFRYSIEKHSENKTAKAKPGKENILSKNVTIQN